MASPRDPSTLNPVSYLSTPLQLLRTDTHAALMSDVTRTGTRTTSTKARTQVHALQSYLMRNNHTVYDLGENTIYAPPPIPVPENGDYFSYCTAVFHAKIVRDGSILGYIIREAGTERQLVKIHFHGDTSNPFSRAFKAFVRSPVLKWDVENWGLFQDLPKGTNLGLIQEVFPDNRVFFPAKALVGVPRLEMQVAATLGTRYLFAVTGISEPVGDVESGILGRFAPRSESYQMVLRNCTREEAVLWLCLLVATDMKRRKSQNARIGSPFLPVYL